MKKVLVFLSLTLALLLCLVSCFGQTEHTHKFTEWSVTKNPTCTEDGVKTRYCDCGEKQSDTISATGHNYVDNVCTNCGVEHIMSACKHDDPEKIVVVDYKSPTCIETGLTQGMKCLNCETMVVPQLIIPTTECTDLVNLPYKAPTCQETGLGEGKQCNICGTIVVKQEILPQINCIQGEEYYVIEDTIYLECIMCGDKIDCHLLVPSMGLEFTLNPEGRGYGVSGIGTCLDRIVVIPPEYNGLPVIAINNGAFWNNDKITAIVIPASVEEIQTASISSCTALKNVLVCENSRLVDIKPFQFNSCTSLVKWEIPSSVESMLLGHYVESVAPALIYNVYGNGLYLGNKDNPYHVLVKPISQDITTLTIHENTKIILNEYFNSCESLEFNVYDNALYLGTVNNPYFALYSALNESITACKIHEDTKIMANSVFNQCGNITSIGPMGSGASVEIPEGITCISYGAFMSCESLVDVIIPESITTIGQGAFRNNKLLQNFVIPTSVTTLCQNLFYTRDGECSPIINYSGTVEEWNNIVKLAPWGGCESTEVICSDGVVPLK